MSLIYFITGLKAIEYNISIEFSILFLVGTLMIVLGNYMGKIKSNWFMGIRTPWTLSSEEVWNKTHRVAGWYFITGGLLMYLEYLVSPACKPYLLALIIVILVIGPVGTSYYFYYLEQKNERNNKPTK